MLVLSRLSDQRIVIPQFGISIVLIDVRGDMVRLGVEADESIAIFREEVWNAIKQKDPVRAAEIESRGKSTGSPGSMES